MYKCKTLVLSVITVTLVLAPSTAAIAIVQSHCNILVKSQVTTQVTIQVTIGVCPLRPHCTGKLG